VFGSSAAGKETFLRTVQQNGTTTLLQALGWSNPVIICEESIAWVAQFENDPLGTERRRLPEKIVQYATENKTAVICIKGQDLDLENNRLEIVREKLPEYEHHIFFLEVSIKELTFRVRSKPWWTEENDEEEMQEWLEYQKTFLRKIEKDFIVTVLDAENGTQYPVLGNQII
jgi:hypothetical protein